MKIKTLLSSLFLISSSFVMTGCHSMVILNSKGLIGQDESDLFLISLLLMLVIVVPVIVLTLVIAFRSRASNLKAHYRPDWGHSTMLEVICWSVPIVMIAGLAILTWFSTHRLDPYKPLVSHKAPVEVQVVALNWRWLFIYPEQHIATINALEFPAETPIHFVLTSTGPMNVFHIPQLGTQIYAMAGMKTQLHLIAGEKGEYSGRSLNYSGDGFSEMHFIAKAVSEAEFVAWVKKVQSSPNMLDQKAYEALVPDSQDEQLQYFGKVQPDLFDTIIMNMMMPMPIKKD